MKHRGSISLKILSTMIHMTKKQGQPLNKSQKAPEELYYSTQLSIHSKQTK